MELLELAKELISYDTSNPPGTQKECAKFIADYLSNFSSVKTFECDGVLNVLAEVEFGKGPVFVLNGHWDVVPALREEWDFDPFKPRVEGDWLFGRGACDMKGGLACQIKAFEELSKEKLRGKIVFMAVGDEETGGTKGTGFLVEKIEKLDYVLISEATDLKVKVGRRGTCWLELEIIGESRHSSRVVDKYLSCIEVASELVLFLRRKKWDSGLDLLPRTTSVVTMFESGIKENVLPERARIVIDIRNSATSAEGVVKGIKEFLEGLKEEYGNFSYEIKKKRVLTKPYLLKESELVRIACEALRKNGIRPELDTSGGASDAWFFVNLGVRNVVEIGPVGRGGHGKNERVSISSLYKLKNVIKDVVKGALK